MVDIPEQAVQAALEAYERVAGVNPRLSYPARFAVKAALAAAAPYMSGVKVKQLEWVETEFYMSADTEIGGYYAYLLDEHLDQSWRCIDLDGDPIGQFKDIESAKAAAQADYEKRILNALELTSEREQALEETINVKGLDTLKQNSE